MSCSSLALLAVLALAGVALAEPEVYQPDVAYLLMDDYFQNRYPDQPVNLHWQILVESDREAVKVAIYNWGRLTVDSPPLSPPVAMETFRPGLPSATDASKLKEFLDNALYPLLDKHVPKSAHRFTGLLVAVPTSYYSTAAANLPSLMDNEHTYGHFEVVKRESFAKKSLAYETIRQRKPENFGAISIDSDSARISFYDEDTGDMVLEEFPGFGLENSRQTYFDVLLWQVRQETGVQKFMREMMKKKADGDVIAVQDPCSPKGFVSMPMFRPILRRHKLLSSSVDNIEEEFLAYKLIGSGNYQKCQKLVEDMFSLIKREKHACEDEFQCNEDKLGSSFIRFGNLGLVGLEDVYNVLDTVFRSKTIYNHVAMAAKNKEMCEMQWADFEKSLAGRAKNFEAHCYYGVYLDTFLSQGLRIPTNYRNLKTHKYTGDADILLNHDALRNIWSDARWLDRDDSEDLAAPEENDKPQRGSRSWLSG